MSDALIRTGQSRGMSQAIGGIKDGQPFIERRERTFQQSLAKTTHLLDGLKLVAISRGEVLD
jgi:hypothetical protein